MAQQVDQAGAARAAARRRVRIGVEVVVLLSLVAYAAIYFFHQRMDTNPPYSIEGVPVLATEAEARAIVSPARRRYEGGRAFDIAGGSLEFSGWQVVRVGNRVEDFWPRLSWLDSRWSGPLTSCSPFPDGNNPETMFERRLDSREGENFQGRTLFIGADDGRVTYIVCMGMCFTDYYPDSDWFAKSLWTTGRPLKPGRPFP